MSTSSRTHGLGALFSEWAAAVSRLVGYSVAVAVILLLFIPALFSHKMRKALGGQHLGGPAFKGFRKSMSDTTRTSVLLVRRLAAIYAGLWRDTRSVPTFAAMMLFTVCLVLLLGFAGVSAYRMVNHTVNGRSSTEILADSGGHTPTTPEQVDALLGKASPGEVGTVLGQAGNGIPGVGTHAQVADLYRSLDGQPGDGSPQGQMVDSYRNAYCDGAPKECLPMTADGFNSLVAGTPASTLNPWLRDGDVPTGSASSVVGVYAKPKLGLPPVGDDAATVAYGNTLNAPYDDGKTTEQSDDLAAVYARLRSS